MEGKKMIVRMKYCLPFLVLSMMPACATYTQPTPYLLGGATAANIAEQSIRDVNVPNSEEIQSSSGVRAANAVRALNEGKRKELPTSGLGGAGETS